MGHPVLFSSPLRWMRCGVPTRFCVVFEPFLLRCAGEVLLRSGYVEEVGLEWIAADEEASVAKFLAFANVGDIV
jgi:hypothetical protein